MASWNPAPLYDSVYRWPNEYYIGQPASIQDQTSQWHGPFANYSVMQHQNMHPIQQMTNSNFFPGPVSSHNSLQYVIPHQAYSPQQRVPSWAYPQSYRPGPQPSTASGFDTTSPQFPNGQAIYNKWPQGPPTKPKQSGHAVWVGNLPHSTNIVYLKDHFSQGATNEIESVRLLSQTNCAFINFSSQRACSDAVRRHDRQLFQGYRLVCRFRGDITVRNSRLETEPGLGHTSVSHSPVSNTQLLQPPPNELPSDKVSTKYFILKSLTVGDLEASVRNGSWNPQIHHQDALNEAFETSDTVWLVFSVNKSREFFGVARMCSPCKPSSESDISVTHGAVPTQPGSSYTAFASQQSNTPTARNALAPPGVVIQDRARGTIFWERRDDPMASIKGAAVPASLQSFTTASPLISAFKVDWISLQRVPFKRTRGLRNAYNDNQIIQVARDGTPIDPVSGAKIISLFGADPPISTEFPVDLARSPPHASSPIKTSANLDHEADSGDTSPCALEQMVGKMTLTELPVVRGEVPPN